MGCHTVTVFEHRQKHMLRPDLSGSEMCRLILAFLQNVFQSGASFDSSSVRCSSCRTGYQQIHRFFHLLFVHFILVKYLTCNSCIDSLQSEKKMFRPDIWMPVRLRNLLCHIQRFLRLLCILILCHNLVSLSLSLINPVSPLMQYCRMTAFTGIIYILHKSHLPIHVLLPG